MSEDAVKINARSKIYMSLSERTSVDSRAASGDLDVFGSSYTDTCMIIHSLLFQIAPEKLHLEEQEHSQNTKILVSHCQCS